MNKSSLSLSDTEVKFKALCDHINQFTPQQLQEALLSHPGIYRVEFFTKEDEAKCEEIAREVGLKVSEIIKRNTTQVYSSHSVDDYLFEHPPYSDGGREHDDRD